MPAHRRSVFARTTRRTAGVRMPGAICRLVVAAALAGVILPSADHNVRALERQTPYRSGIDLVMLHVTVTDKSGRYVTNLGRDEFLVFENGRPQELEFVQQGGLPLAVSLLLDTSSSVQQAFPVVRQAAVRFLGTLEPTDLASVVAFGQKVQLLHDFTGDHGAAGDAIGVTRPRGGTALYNAIYVTLKELFKPPVDQLTAIPRRRTAIVLSDGDDTSSLIGFDDVLDLAARTDVVFYTIGFNRSESALRHPHHAEVVLRQLARHTGGRAFFPMKRYELLRVYEQIRAELSSQYTLAYVSSDAHRDGRFRQVSVQVQRAGAQARTRRGYFASDR